MRLRRNEFCPIHKSISCCGRENLPKPRLIRMGVQWVEDPHHPRGYRELRSPAEMRKLMNRKIVEQGGILKNGRVPAVDIFSFTRSGEPWIAWEWLSDVLMAVVHERSSLAGIVLVSLVLLGATSAFVYRSTLGESGHRVIAIVLTGLAMAASTVHWLARPHLVTPLFASVFCCVLNQTERNRRSVLLWILPLLTIPWVNLHGGFFVGIILLVTYAIGMAAEELLDGRRRKAWVRARPYLWTAASCALATLVNPYGYHLHVHVTRYLGASFYLQRISEFQSIDFHSFTAAYFETLLVLAIAAAAWHIGKGRWVQVLLLLSWSHLALFSARNIPIFGVVAAPGIGLAMREWLEYASSCWPLEWPGRFGASLAELDTGLRIMASRAPSWRVVAGIPAGPSWSSEVPAIGL
jgi:hypothetical protein